MTRSARKVTDQSGRKLGPRALETRQKLLDATLTLLGERSVLEVSVAEVARHVGIAPSLFYHYFKDVEEVARHIARDAAAETAEMGGLVAEGLGGATGLARARALVETYIDHWERFRGALLFRNQAADRGDPTFLRIRRDALGPLIDVLRDHVAGAQARGEVAADVHPSIAASGLVAMLESLAAHAERVQRFDASRAQLVDTCARMIQSTATGER